MFLFHMPRSSIHFMPKSDATWHARSKSWLISSLMTATRNGELATPAKARGSAQAAVAKPAPAMNCLREKERVIGRQQNWRSHINTEKKQGCTRKKSWEL